MEIAEVTTFLDSNKDKPEVQAFIKGFYTPDKLNPLLDSDDGLKIIQPRLDSNFTKGLETWKKNNLKALVDTEVKKLNPDLTPEQKRLKELEGEIDNQKKENLRTTLKNKVIEKLTEHKLPLKFSNYLIGSDEDSTLANVKAFKEVWDAEFEKRIEEEFKKNGRIRPGKTTEKGSASKTMNSIIRGN